MNASDHKCPNCNAVLKFDPTSGKWKCEYCASIFSLEEVEVYNKLHKKCPNCEGVLEYDKKNNLWNCKNCQKTFSEETVENYNTIKEPKKRKDTTNNQKSEDLQADFSYYSCPDCGAEIVMDDTTTATFCVYCGNTAIIRNKLQGEFKPSKVIPFKTTKEQAINEFTSYNKGKLFIPKEFTNKNNIEKISGIYIPFFIYDCEVSANIDVRGTKVSHWSDSKFDYTKTDIYNIATSGKMHFENIPVDGSTRFPDDIMNSIEPFYYADLTDFHPSYLSGFLSERYDTSMDELFEIAKNRSITTANQTLLNTITGYTSKSITNNTTTVEKNDTSEYVLLPVWMLNVKYKNQIYTLAMNRSNRKVYWKCSNR